MGSRETGAHAVAKDCTGGALTLSPILLGFEFSCGVSSDTAIGKGSAATARTQLATVTD